MTVNEFLFLRCENELRLSMLANGIGASGANSRYGDENQDRTNYFMDGSWSSHGGINPLLWKYFEINGGAGPVGGHVLSLNEIATKLAKGESIMVYVKQGKGITAGVGSSITGGLDNNQKVGAIGANGGKIIYPGLELISYGKTDETPMDIQLGVLKSTGYKRGTLDWVQTWSENGSNPHLDVNADNKRTPFYLDQYWYPQMSNYPEYIIAFRDSPMRYKEDTKWRAETTLVLRDKNNHYTPLFTIKWGFNIVDWKLSKIQYQILPAPVWNKNYINKLNSK